MFQRLSYSMLLTRLNMLLRKMILHIRMKKVHSLLLSQEHLYGHNLSPRMDCNIQSSAHMLSCVATLGLRRQRLATIERSAMQREAKDFELGEGMYCFVLVCSALVWQCFYLGATGTIHYGSSLLSGVIIAMALPVTEVLAVIIYHEKFQQKKAVPLALSLWGFVSYFYSESKQSERSNKDQTIDHIP